MTSAYILAPLAFACAYSTMLATWVHHFFLKPLSRDAIEMHEKQLDPTEIIAIPYDLERLAIFVSAIVAVVLLEPSNGGWRKLLQLAKLTVLNVGLFVLCGASPFVNRTHTLFAAAYFSTLCWFDPPIFSNSPSPCGLSQQFRNRLRGHSSNAGTSYNSDETRSLARHQQDILASTVLHSTVAFTIPFQILLLYDRGWQVQRWPVSVILGSTCGWIFGTCLGTLLATMTSRIRPETYKKRDDALEN